MIRHDFHCRDCGETQEVGFATFIDFRREVPCLCGGRAFQVWTRAPGLAGVSEPGTRGIAKSFNPGQYDVQAGRVFESRTERDKYVKSRGLVAMGADEYRRSVNGVSGDPEPKFEKAKLREAMEASYAEQKAGKITPHNVIDGRIPITKAN